MFKRWMIIVSVMIALSVAMYFKSETNRLQAKEEWVVIGDECTKHLERQLDDWTSENDSWYRYNCDIEVESSKFNLANRNYSFYSEALGTSMMLVAGCLAIAFVSLIGRWIYLGGKKKTKPRG